MTDPFTDADRPTFLLGVDRAYAMQLATCLRSLALTDPPAGSVAYVVHADYDSALRGRVESSCEDRLSLEWCRVSDEALRDLHVPARLGKATAYRLLAPDLLPRVRRIVYLDADVLVRRSIEPLCKIDLGNQPVAAARDAYIPFVGVELPWRRLGVDPRTPYFNAGVMVIDVDVWREERVAERALDMMREHALSSGDQSALNAVLGSRWQRLDPRWNVQSHHFAGDAGHAWYAEDPAVLQEAIDDPAIVHFCHGTFARPWEAGSSHPFRDEWHTVLDGTAWAGWRPRRQRVAGARRRIERAARGLFRSSVDRP